MSEKQKRTERYDSFICNLCMLVIRSFCRFIAKYIGLRARPISVYTTIQRKPNPKINLSSTNAPKIEKDFRTSLRWIEGVQKSNWKGRTLETPHCLRVVCSLLSDSHHYFLLDPLSEQKHLRALSVAMSVAGEIYVILLNVNHAREKILIIYTVQWLLRSSIFQTIIVL